MFLLGVILRNSTCYKLFQVKREKDFFFTGGSPMISDHHKMRDTINEACSKETAEPPVTLLGAHSELVIPERSFLLRLSTPNYRISFQIHRENKVQSFFARHSLLRHKKSSPLFSRFQTLTLVLVCSVCVYVVCLNLGLD